MRCPKCRQEMPLEALTHGCGWRVSSGGVNVAQALEAPPATIEQRRAHIDRMRLVVRSGKDRERDRENRPDLQVPMLEDVGHGEVCTCEVCWAERMQRMFPGSKVLRAPRKDVAGSPGEPVASPVARPIATPSAAPVVRSRREQLLELFPVP